MRRLLLVFLSILLSQSMMAETKRYFVNRFGTADGLASNQVMALHQDRAGYLWIGTPNGLQRFDGREFVSYQLLTSEPRPSRSVSQILVDKSDRMWLRVGDDYGIYSPEKEQFSKIPFQKPENRYLGEHLWMDSKERMYVILHYTKILWMDPEQGIFTDQNLPIRLPDGWRPKSIFEDQAGLYWISCAEGIAVFDPKSQEIYTKDHNPKQLGVLKKAGLVNVFNVYQDKTGIFWLNYWDPGEHLESYDPKSQEWKDHKAEILPSTPNYQEAFGVLELEDGGLWRYGIQTLADLDRKDNRYRPLIQSDLVYDKIFEIENDRAGGLWLATDSGLYFIHFDTPDIYYNRMNSSQGNYEFQAIEEVIYDGDTTIWIGSWGKGIKLFKPLFGEISSDWLRKASNGTTESQQVWDILWDRKRNFVWITHQSGLLEIVDLKTKKLVSVYPEALEKVTLRSLAQDARGDIYIGTQHGLVVRYTGDGYRPEGFSRLRKFKGTIPRLMVSRDQHLWVTTQNEGVYVMDTQTGDLVRHLDKSVLNSNNIEKMHQLNDSIFLLGSDLLNKYNFKTGENEVFSYADGLASNGVFHIESDRAGLVWIYTPNGMSRFDPQDNTFSSFGKNHFFAGLPSDGHGGTRFSTGELAFLSNNSILIFNPLQFDRNLTPLLPAITSVELFHTYVGDGNSVDPRREFSSQENSLSFSFNILNFPRQDRFVYYYRLVGAESDWIEAKGKFEARYALLPPGKYRFEVRSANEAGEFSEAVGYDFEIKPSLIQTWWFKALLALLFLGIVAAIYRMHLNRILAVVNIRTRLARDLHDDMGSTLSTINILSSMAKTKLGTDPAKTTEYISRISENSQRMMESMDDIVWSIKPQNDSMEKLVARMREFASEVLESRDIQLQMEVEERVLGMRLSMDAIRDLFLIFKEAVNNTAKYSGAAHVTIAFGMDKSVFSMKIADDGRGFDPTTEEEGNGLGNMRKRAANLKGRISIEASPGNGTKISLLVEL